MECPNCARLEAEVARLQRRVFELEEQVRDLLRRLGQNSSNSHRPPSSDPPDAPRRPRHPDPRRPGALPGHPGHARALLPGDQVDHIVTHLPRACADCGQALPPQPGPDDPAPFRHQITELAPRLITVTEHQAHARRCPACGHLNRAALPAEVGRHAFGPRLTATVGYLSGRAHLSKRQSEELFETLLGVPIALGSVSACEAELSQALRPAYQQVQQTVRAAQAKGVDETSWRRAGLTSWLWLAAAPRHALFKLHPERKRHGLWSLLGRSFQGHHTTDRWHVYNRLPLSQRQLCWAHLDRDFQALAERGEGAQALAAAGLAAADEVFAAWRAFREGRLPDRVALQERLTPQRQAFERSLQQAASAPHKPSARLARRLLNLFPALWAFTRLPDVEPTNNFAERLLRGPVLWRKRSLGCFSERGCRFVERLLTAVETLRLQKRPVLDFLARTLLHYRLSRPPPALLDSG